MASSAVEALLVGPRRTGRVVTATRHAVVVTVESAARHPDVVCVSGPDAVRLPCALVLTTPPPVAEVGAPAAVGRGRVRVGGEVVAVARWWRVPRPVLTDPRAAAAKAASYPVPAPPPDVPPDVTHAESADLPSCVPRLLGLGPGLTPAGDDVLAGALVALSAAAHPAAGRLVAAVAAARPFTRTTTVSAALLAHAARGECIPPVAAYLRALDRGTDLEAARADLLGVGHTSGWALLLGVHYGLAATRTDAEAFR
ncbi:MAG: DUF2877 domain-containing protein [Nocardioidaceae bacterium]